MRPSLEQSEEQAADVDMSEAEVAVERQKSIEHQDQQEGQESQQVSSTNYVRKRVASSMIAEPKDESSVQQDSIKRAKALDAPQEAEILAEPSDVVALTEEPQSETEIVEFSEAQVDQGEENRMTGGVDFETKTEEEQHPAEDREGEDLTAEGEGEEEREEGGIQVDAPEIEEGEMDTPLSELIPEEVPEGGDGLEAGSPSLSQSEAEKIERSENVEEPAETPEEKPDNDPEPVLSTQAPTVHLEGNLETEGSGASSSGIADSQSGKGASEEVDQRTRSSRTIILTERAKERALMRQAGMGLIPTPVRGRGRTAGTVFRVCSFPLFYFFLLGKK